MATNIGRAVLAAVAKALKRETQEDLARRLDVSLATMSRWSRRKCAPKGGQARRVLAALEGSDK